MISRSFIDDDLYKFSMQQAVCQLYPNAHAEYRFINRGEHVFPEGFAQALNMEVQRMTDLNKDERDVIYLARTVPFFNPVYLDFLKGYRYDPNEVQITGDGPYNLGITIRGPWYRTILWEVKLMATICELYYRMVGGINAEQLKRARMFAAKKAHDFLVLGVKFADFGTRRRFSATHHGDVMVQLIRNGKESFVGSSNIHFAAESGVKAIGTQAHEWFMFHAAKYGYRYANHMALERWVEVYQGDLGIALSDTFTTGNFFKAFGPKYAKLFDGVRHDSGSPIEFADKMIAHYESLGINPMSKTIVFSDGLNPNTVKEIHEYCEGKIKYSFGIGTNLTSDIPGVTPMNIVIKMTACAPNGDDWVPVVKLSDNPMKHTGDLREVELCKGVLGV